MVSFLLNAQFKIYYFQTSLKFMVRKNKTIKNGSIKVKCLKSSCHHTTIACLD